MIKPVAIDHIVLRTDRYQPLIDFYCRVLGCKVERVLPEEMGMTQLQSGSALIDIIDVTGRLGGPADLRRRIREKIWTTSACKSSLLKKRNSRPTLKSAALPAASSSRESAHRAQGARSTFRIRPAIRSSCVPFYERVSDTAVP